LASTRPISAQRVAQMGAFPSTGWGRTRIEIGNGPHQTGIDPLLSFVFAESGQSESGKRTFTRSRANHLFCLWWQLLAHAAHADYRKLVLGSGGAGGWGNLEPLPVSRSQAYDIVMQLLPDVTLGEHYPANTPRAVSAQRAPASSPEKIRWYRWAHSKRGEQFRDSSPWWLGWMKVELIWIPSGASKTRVITSSCSADLEAGPYDANGRAARHPSRQGAFVKDCPTPAARVSRAVHT
jgi:hypothetical protein